LRYSVAHDGIMLAVETTKENTMEVVLGAHSTSRVAAIHYRLLRTVTVKDLAEILP
jgi:hypothetical protein